MSGKRSIRAPRGPERSCKGWHQEAAMRMLMNNLDPEVAEAPDRLIVYGGSGVAGRSWECFFSTFPSFGSLCKQQNPAFLICNQGGEYSPPTQAPPECMPRFNS